MFSPTGKEIDDFCINVNLRYKNRNQQIKEMAANDNDNYGNYRLNNYLFYLIMLHDRYKIAKTFKD